MAELYRVMATQETGEECCLENDLTETAAYDYVNQHRDDHPEWSMFIEMQIDYYALNTRLYEDNEQDLH